MDKKIVVCIGSDRSGNVRARLSLLIMDGEQEVHEHYHSINLVPGADLVAARRDVETHLAMPKEQSGIPFGPWPRIPDAEWQKVVAVCGVLQA